MAGDQGMKSQQIGRDKSFEQRHRDGRTDERLSGSISKKQGQKKAREVNEGS